MRPRGSRITSHSEGKKISCSSWRLFLSFVFAGCGQVQPLVAVSSHVEAPCGTTCKTNWRRIDVPALLSRERQGSGHRMQLQAYRSPQGRYCQESRSCLSNKDMSKRPSVSIHTSSACQCDPLPRVVSVICATDIKSRPSRTSSYVFQEAPRSKSQSLASGILAESSTQCSGDELST